MTSEFQPRRIFATALALSALVCFCAASATDEKPRQANLLAQNNLGSQESGVRNTPEKADGSATSSTARNPALDLLTQQQGSTAADEMLTDTTGGRYLSLTPLNNFWISLGLVMSVISLALAVWATALARKSLSRVSHSSRRLETAVSDANDISDRRGADHRRDIDLLRQELNALSQRALAAKNQNTHSSVTSDQAAAPFSDQRAPMLRPTQGISSGSSPDVVQLPKSPRTPEVIGFAEDRHPVSATVLNAEVLNSIELLAKAGTQITEANAAVRIIGSSYSDELKQGLQKANLNISFYTAAGDASAINAELLAWNWSDQHTFQVIPHPHAGRVGQFNKWFDLGNGDYGTQPVLASRPATAQLVNQKLVPVALGTLR